MLGSKPLKLATKMVYPNIDMILLMVQKSGETHLLSALKPSIPLAAIDFFAAAAPTEVQSLANFGGEAQMTMESP